MLLGSVLLPFLFAQVGFSQSISVDGVAFKGDMNARVTLIEFADYQCSFCGRFYRETFAKIGRIISVLTPTISYCASLTRLSRTN
jgi:thioredoxin-related protein